MSEAEVQRLMEPATAAPAAPEVPNSPGFPDGSLVTMTITGPCESVWAAERRLLDQLRGWLIVRETTDGQRGTQEIVAVLTDQADRPFTAHKEYPAPADARDARRHLTDEDCERLKPKNREEAIAFLKRVGILTEDGGPSPNYYSAEEIEAHACRAAMAAPQPKE